MQNKHDYRFHALLHSADLVEEKLRENLMPLEIRPKQARVLGALDLIGSVSQVELARKVNVTAGSMSTMVTRLEKLGLISRERQPCERRSDVLSLTDAGRLQLEDIHQTWKAMDEYIEKTIGGEKALMLAKLTEELRLALGGQVPSDNTRDSQ